jgi:hypothetical protein
LYKDWFLFVDDLSIATGRKKCHGDGPSGAHDVSCRIRERRTTKGERAARGLGLCAGKSNPSPFAHVVTLFQVVLVMIVFVIVAAVMVMERWKEECIIIMKSQRGMLLFVVLFVHIATISSSLCMGSNPGTVYVPWVQSLSCFADYRLYKLGTELQEDQLGYSAVLAAFHAPSSADMPKRPSWHPPTSTTEYYYPTSDVIPTAAWSIGDEPVDGRVHVVLDVTGDAFGSVNHRSKHGPFSSQEV